MTAHTQSINPPSFIKLLLEARTAPELGAYFASLPLLQATPIGDGHPVMVFPGFMASDVSTIPLRTFLKSRGYAPYGWGMGRNYGRGIDVDEGVTRRTQSYRKLLYLHSKHGRKVSLIGWSLGGIYARELARLAPHAVRQVITLGSPFTGDRRANNVVAMFEMMSGKSLDDFNPEVIKRARTSPPVPTTAIFTRTDGIAAWQCCIEDADWHSENIEVESSHCGLGHNPVVLYAIADRLAQQENNWKAFDRTGLRKLFFYDPDRKTPW